MKRAQANLIVAAALLAASATSNAGPTTGPDEQQAIAAEWQSHQVRFRYAGFTSAYTCRGLEGKLEKLLRAFGAREDAKVEVPCYGDSSRVWPMYQATLGFAVPVPAEEGVSPDTFPAAWQDVEISRNQPRTIDGGDCELVEQFVEQVVPLFGPVDLEDRTRCVPNQRTLGSPRVEARVLKALDRGEADTVTGH